MRSASSFSAESAGLLVKILVEKLFSCRRSPFNRGLNAASRSGWRRTSSTECHSSRLSPVARVCNQVSDKAVKMLFSAIVKHQLSRHSGSGSGVVIVTSDRSTLSAICSTVSKRAFVAVVQVGGGVSDLARSGR